MTTPILCAFLLLGFCACATPESRMVDCVDRVQSQAAHMTPDEELFLLGGCEAEYRGDR